MQMSNNINAIIFLKFKIEKNKKYWYNKKRIGAIIYDKNSLYRPSQL